MLRLAILVTTPLLAVGSLQAQSELTPGAWVRIAGSIQPAHSIEGTLMTSTPNRLILARDQPAETLYVPLASIERLEVRVARSRPVLVLEGAGAGLLVGGVGGALVGPLFTSACLSAQKTLETNGRCAGSQVFDLDARVRGAVAFGVGGAVLGAVIGGIVGRERWRRVRLGVGAGSDPVVGATFEF